MRIRIDLFGALRDVDAKGYVELEVPRGSSVGALREHLRAHVRQHAPSIGDNLIRGSAFADAHEILHDHRVIPEDGELALLPPVSGG
ncbi:sulfur transfer protein ThiS [Burkholderiales bacterium GJ-E10]|nr:sulfur transfer protein ThiS [Burkholderiales bacterium GJ-E10]